MRILVFYEGTHLSWSAHRGQRATKGVSPSLPPCLRQRLLLLATVYARLADPSVSRGSPVSTSCCTIEKHGITDVSCSTASGFHGF